MVKNLIKDLEESADKMQAESLQRFFKTGKGEYGEGDVFLGVKVPIQRKICKKYDLPLAENQKLLNSNIHEHRLCALFCLTKNFKKSNNIEQGEIFKFYLDNARKINNWDLVDLSAPSIVGEYLIEHPELKIILKKLAESDNLWEKRIAIISTYAFIKKGMLEDALSISCSLLNDKHDIIHKAVGWMLREVGKRDIGALECFIRSYYHNMPRTTLRYSIEKFPEEKRKKFLKGDFT